MYRLKEGKISSHGLFSVVVIMLITKLFLGVPRVMIIEGGSAGWLLMLASAILASIGVYIITRLLVRFPSKNITEIGQEVWGVPGRILVSILVAVLFLSSAIIIVRELLPLQP